MPILPPPRRQEPATTQSEEAPLPQDATEAAEPVAVKEPVEKPVKKATVKPKKAPPAKAQAKKAAPAKAAPAKAAPAKAAPAKAAPAKAAPAKAAPRKGPVAATEIKIPKVPALKTKKCNEDQLFIWELLHVMRMGKVVFVGHTKNKHIELRGFDDRAKAFIATNIKIPPKGAYVQAADVEAVVNFIRPWVPQEMAGKKWGKALYPDA